MKRNQSTRKEFYNQEEDNSNKRKDKLTVLVGAVTLMLAGITAVTIANNDIHYSQETHQETAHQGDTVYGMTKTIENHEQVNSSMLVEHLKSTNPGLSNGLQVNETVVVPDKVLTDE